MDAVPNWEYQAWCEWKDEAFKQPTLTDYQLMRLGMLIERNTYKQEHWKELGLFNLERQRVTFEEKQSKPPTPAEPSREPTEEERRAATERWKALTHYDPERAARMTRLKEQRGRRNRN